MVAKAFDFMVTKHAGQKRKYNGNPYWLHPLEVATLLWESNYCRSFEGYLKSSEDIELICAALLHDIIEDTNTNEIELTAEFNDKVAMLVFWVSHPSNVKGNRAHRHEQYLIHYATAPSPARALKMADRICNLAEFVRDYPQLDEQAISFLRKVYIKESKDLLKVCSGVYVPFDKSLEILINVLEEKTNGNCN